MDRNCRSRQLSWLAILSVLHVLGMATYACAQVQVSSSLSAPTGTADPSRLSSREETVRARARTLAKSLESSGLANRRTDAALLALGDALASAADHERLYLVAWIGLRLHVDDPDRSNYPHPLLAIFRRVRAPGLTKFDTCFTYSEHWSYAALQRQRSYYQSVGILDSALERGLAMAYFPLAVGKPGVNKAMLRLDYARLLTACGVSDTAISQCRAAIADLDTAPTSSRLDKCEAWRLLAEALSSDGQSHPAREALETAQSHWDASKAADSHPTRNAPLRMTRARLAYSQGESAEAIEQLQDVIATLEKHLPIADPRLATVYDRLADYLVKHGDEPEAQRMRIGACKVRLSARDDLDLDYRFRESDARSAVLLPSGAAPDTAMLSAAIDVLLNTRFAVTSEWAVQERDSEMLSNLGDRTAEEGRQQKRLTEVVVMRRRRHLELYFRPWCVNWSMDAAALRRYAKTEQELLDAAGEPGYRRLPLQEVLTQEKLVSRLPERTAVVACFRVGSGERDSSRYVAFVVQKASSPSVSVIDLGATETVEGAVRVLSEGIRAGSPDPASSSRASAYKTPYNEACARFARVFAAIDSNVERIVFCPDHALWFVPWEALPIEGERFAVEDFRIDYATSPVDLVAKRLKAADLNAPAVFAGIDYDATLERVGASAARAAKPASDWESQPMDWWDYYRRFDGVTNFPQTLPSLEGSGAEGQAVLPLLERITGRKPQLYSGADAHLMSLKALKRPAVLLLSTHAFFADPAEFRLPANHPQRGRRWTYPDNAAHTIPPFGVVALAGYNQMGRGGHVSDQRVRAFVRWGMLTSKDAHVFFDGDYFPFRGTSPVVLSACDTAIGTENYDGSVASLRAMFHQLGAPDVLATLWPIPDQQSARLMEVFFSGMADGKSISVALRDAKIETINRLRRDGGAAQARDWAAFTLTGIGQGHLE